MKKFNEKLYFKRIQFLGFLNYVKALSIIVIFIFVAALINNFFIKKDLIIAILISLVIGIIIAFISYYNKQQKIEEMKMKFDMYNIIEEIKEKLE